MVPLAPREHSMNKKRLIIPNYRGNNNTNVNHKKNLISTMSMSSSSPSFDLDQTSHSRIKTFGNISTICTQTMPTKENTTNNNGWRRYGIERRMLLLTQDEATGGNCFDLNYQCRIQGYFALSEKIISKFNDASTNGTDLESTYVMGNRLQHFLTEALPRHPSYMKKDPVVTRLREKSFQSLVQIQKRIEALALRIDEEQLNKYIMHDFDPFAINDDDDDDDASSSSSSFSNDDDNSSKKKINEIEWENFDDWSFDLPEKLTHFDNNKKNNNDNHSDNNNLNFVSSASVQDVSFDNENACRRQDLDLTGDTEDTSNETFSSSETSFQASDEEDEDHEPIYNSFGLDFLRRIASEDVRYETDSEAADSWAQEGESEIESTVHSSTTNGSSTNTYDPARIALKELMINKKRHRGAGGDVGPSFQRASSGFKNSSSQQYPFDCDDDDECDDDSRQDEDGKENHSVNFELSPDNSFDSAQEEEIWIAFDPTTLLPTNGIPAERVSL